mgnify:CR=1 FL=1
MNYNSDKPIKSSEQDLLGRVTFSKQLGEAIYKYDGKDGLVLGVFGKWGTGKTSILNMVVNEINCLSDNDDDSPIIVNFSAFPSVSLIYLFVALDFFFFFFLLGMGSPFFALAVL